MFHKLFAIFRSVDKEIDKALSVELPLECNCAWNPDRHADSCPVNMRDRLTDAQALLAEKDARIAQLAAHARGKNKALANALKEIERLRLNIAEYNEHERCWRSEIADLRAQLQAAAEPWISVSERLPDIAQEVIVHTQFDGVCAGVLDSYGEWFAPSSDYKLTRVNSWMPLPAAPATADSDAREVSE